MSETTPESDPRSDEARIAEDVGQPEENPPGPDHAGGAGAEASEEPDGGTDPT